MAQRSAAASSSSTPRARQGHRNIVPKELFIDSKWFSLLCFVLAVLGVWQFRWEVRFLHPNSNNSASSGSFTSTKHPAAVPSSLLPLLKSMLEVERQDNLAFQCANNKKIAVGYVACLDVIVNATGFFSAMRLSSNVDTFHHETIRTGRDLAETYAFFFERGAAAERYCSDKLLFDRLKRLARNVPGAVVEIGGNGAVFANTLAQL